MQRQVRIRQLGAGLGQVARRSHQRGRAGVGLCTLEQCAGAMCWQACDGTRHLGWHCLYRSTGCTTACLCCSLLRPPQVVSSQFTKSVIRSRAALTYAEAQSRIDDERLTDELSVRGARCPPAAGAASGGINAASVTHIVASPARAPYPALDQPIRQPTNQPTESKSHTHVHTRMCAPSLCCRPTCAP